MENLKDWFPLLEKLIWPLFIVIFFIFFRDKIEGMYNMVVEGRSVKIGGWFEIGEKIKETEIQTFAKTDVTVDAFAGAQEVVTRKGGPSMLSKLQDKLKSGEIKHINVLEINNQIYYNKDLLLKYVGTLGIKHIVFIKDGVFEGWMESSIFSSQVFNFQRSSFDYIQLTENLSGIEKTKVAPTEKTDMVLELMIKDGIESVPIVESNQFKYFVNKGDILATLVSNAILKN